MAYLYAFLDESGNFDFSNGTGASEWLVMTSLLTPAPTEKVVELYRAKHQLIEAGHDVERFHATEDLQVVRDSVFSILADMKRASVDCIAVRKRRLDPSWRDPHEIYPRLLETLLPHALEPYMCGTGIYERVFVIMDRVQLPRKKREALIGGIKSSLKSCLGSTPFTVLMHQSASHPYLQAVDYFCWALFVIREREERRPWPQIRHLVHDDVEMPGLGARDWY